MALPQPETPDLDEIRERIGHAVRVVMKARRATGRDVAQALFLSEGAVSERLSGKTPFKADELEVLARALRVEPGVFYQDPDDLFRIGSLSTVEDHGQMILPLGHEAPSLELVDA